MSRAEARTYSRVQCVSFRKTDEEFGGLSNMAPGFPLEVNGIAIRTSEALYQACRFPHLPKVQRLIIDETSPMTAKMKSKPYRKQSRPDWDAVRVKVMRWVLRVKLAQNWEKFGALLLDTGDRPIVEDSRKDDFWGAKALEGGKLAGANVLGRLLMELRGQLRGPDPDSLRHVEALPIPDFLLYAEPIGGVEGCTTGVRVGNSPLTSRGGSGSEQGMPRPTSVSLAIDASETASNAGSVTTKQPSESPEAHRTTSKAGQSPKRLIEVDLPIKRISAHARREKSIRHGHISTLHIWWARRPLAACRAVILAALWPDPADENCPERFRKAARDRMLRWALDSPAKASAESFDRLMRIQKDDRLLDDPIELRKCLLDFIADFANWDNSTDPAFLELSRALVQVAHEALGGAPATRPLVVDPFAGGGAIPLEALRVGADAFASDLNPVAVLLNKVVLEYIPKYGQRLADEVRTWGAWVKKEAEKELAAFYPKDPDGATPIAYLWARTIQCEGPGCGAQVPLIRSPWLSKKRGRYVAVRVMASKQTRQVDLSLVEPSSVGAVPERATSVGGAAVCPVCNHTTSVERVRVQLGAKHGGAANARLMAVVVSRPSTDGRGYRPAISTDEAAARQAWERLTRLTDVPRAGLPVLPDGTLNHLRGFFNVVLYGMTRWGDLFSPRQALALVVFSDLVRGMAARLATQTDRQLALAIQTCLAIVVDRQAEKLSSLARWDTSRENAQGTFGRQALPMVWDFCEANPFSGSGGDWDTAVDWVARVAENIGAMSVGLTGVGHAARASASASPLPADGASAVITDPPYYAAVPYADLSDFFYEWLRRSLAGQHADLLADQLTPKADELVSLAHRAAMYREKDGAWFERGMQKACEEGRRVCMPSGLGLYVFASKETPAWEAMLAALIEAGWVVSASWPIDTEMGSRLRARDSATLASSVHIACRPRENPDGSLRTDAVGDWRDVLVELPKRIHDWMPRLAEEGIVGADAIFACLGPALEIFSRHARVEKASGEVVPLKEYLEHVWAAVAREALTMIFAGAETSGFEEDARLTAMWLWTVSTGSNGAYGSKADDGEDSDEDGDGGKTSKKAKLGGFALEYDAARKIAQGLGAHLEDLTSLVEVNGETARLLPVAERTRALFGRSEAEAPTARRKKRVQQMKLGFAEELEEAEETGGWGQKGAPKLGETVLDRVHQSMILFAAGRGEALRRFLVDEAAGSDARFWRLAQALAALYPTGTDERRWVEGVLARKKGLGF